ncbi:MAG: permease [Myxococcota bacterium]|nr:permease [Myxococcota bacterium]
MPLITTLLLISVLGLLAGPLMLQVRTDLERTGAVLDGFALVTVGGLVVLHLLPEAIEHAGWSALGFAFAGAVIPLWMDRNAISTNGSVQPLLLLVGLAPHAAVESASLSLAGEASVLALGASIAAHRLPVGLILFSMIRQHHGVARAWAAILIMVLATLGGFWLGATPTGGLAEQPFAWLQALVGGSLLHVAFSHHLHDCTTHAHTHDHSQHDDAPHSHGQELSSAWAASGALLGGMVLVLALSTSPGHHHGGSALRLLDTFWILSAKSAPLLVIGYLLAGLVRGFGTPITPLRLHSSSQLGQAIRGLRFGARLPVCSCGVLPTYETLVKNAAPGIAALGFLVATPGIGLETLLFSLPLLGTKLTLARLGCALLVAVGTSLVVGRLLSQTPDSPLQETAETPPEDDARSGLKFGLQELFDHTFPWILAGLLTAACMEPLLSHSLLTGVPSVVQVVLLGLLGIPFYICASGATPIAAIAIHQGVSPGAALAFLLIGPATNLATYRTLGELHSPAIARLFTVAVTAGAIGAGLAVDLMSVNVLSQLHTTHAPEFAGTTLVAVSLLGLLAVMSLYRQGPRGMLAKISSPIQTENS